MSAPVVAEMRCAHFKTALNLYATLLLVKLNVTRRAGQLRNAKELLDEALLSYNSSNSNTIDSTVILIGTVVVQ